QGDVRDARHQLLDPGRRHAAVSDMERVQMIERRETREAGVRYFRTIQIQLFEARHALQMSEPAIRDVRAEQIESPEVRQSCKMREAGVGDAGAVQRELAQLRQPREVPQPLVSDGGARQIQLVEGGHAADVAQSAIVEKPIVAEIEISEFRERRERRAWKIRLMQAQFGQRCDGREPLEHRIFERDVGLNRFAQYELLELGRSREQPDSVGDERHRLVVPKPAVEIQLLQMRKPWKPRQLVLQSPRAHRHADEIQRVDLEVGIRQIVEIADGDVLSLEDDGAAETQYAFG